MTYMPRENCRHRLGPAVFCSFVKNLYSLFDRKFRFGKLQRCPNIYFTDDRLLGIFSVIVDTNKHE